VYAGNVCVVDCKCMQLTAVSFLFQLRADRIHNLQKSEYGNSVYFGTNYIFLTSSVIIFIFVTYSTGNFQYRILFKFSTASQLIPYLTPDAYNMKYFFIYSS
jgi:hypothetical protein